MNSSKTPIMKTPTLITVVVVAAPTALRVHIEEGKLLAVSGERTRREREKRERRQGSEVKYVVMQRRFGKFLTKFALPDSADTEKVSASCEDGMVTEVFGKNGGSGAEEAGDG
ncbi:hypothetical protein LguiB_009656 [Lonicera macranthoides]